MKLLKIVNYKRKIKNYSNNLLIMKNYKKDNQLQKILINKKMN